MCDFTTGEPLVDGAQGDAEEWVSGMADLSGALALLGVCFLVSGASFAVRWGEVVRESARNASCLCTLCSCQTGDAAGAHEEGAHRDQSGIAAFLRHVCAMRSLRSAPPVSILMMTDDD